MNKYKKNCPDCGAIQEYGRKDHYNNAVRGNWKCNSCANRDNNFAGKYERIPITWFETKRRGGLSRGYNWDLTIEFIWDLYVKQNGKCALSGFEIGWPDKGLTSTVSIDRMDNSEGYLTTNVHLVHKDVNMMKGRLDLDRFTELCKAIADKVKW